MVHKCCFPQCKGHLSGVSQFRFPKNDSRRKAWIDFVREANNNSRWTPPKDFSSLCALHFTSDCILSGLGGVRSTVLPHAIPTLYSTGESTTTEDEAEGFLTIQTEPAEPEECTFKSISLKENCLICQEKAVTLRIPPNNSETNARYWILDNSEALCQLLNLDPRKYAPGFQTAAYCESCYVLFTDVLYLNLSIQRFEDRLNYIKTQVTSLMTTNYIKCQVKEEPTAVYFDDSEHGSYMGILEPIAIELAKQHNENVAQTEIGLDLDLVKEEVPFFHEFESYEEPIEDPLKFGEQEIVNSNDTNQLGISTIVVEKSKRKCRNREIEDADWFPDNETQNRNKNVTPPTKKLKQNENVTLPAEKPKQNEDASPEVNQQTATAAMPLAKKLKYRDVDQCYINERLKATYGTTRLPTIRDKILPYTFNASGKKVKHKCPQCSTVFFKEHFLLAHIQWEHKDPGDPLPFHCQKCPEKFLTISSLGTHVLKGHEKINFECDKCSLCLETWDDYTNHRQSHLTALLRLEYPKCDMRTPEELAGHSHSQDVNSTACVPSYEEFPNTLHGNENHVTLDFYCTQEGCTEEPFETKFSLDQHVTRVHSPDPELECTTPTDDLGHPEPKLHCHSLAIQGQGHDTMPYKCYKTDCNSSFKFRAELTRHLVTHEGTVRGHVCHICQKMFNFKSVLTTHLAHHGDEKPFQCEQCPYGAKTRKTLYNHVYRNHRIEPLVEKPPTPGTEPRKTFVMYRPGDMELDMDTVTNNSTEITNNGLNDICSVCGSNNARKLPSGNAACDSCRIFYQINYGKDHGGRELCTFENNCQISFDTPNCTPCKFRKCVGVGLAVESHETGTGFRRSSNRRYDMTDPRNVTPCNGCGDIILKRFSGVHLCRLCRKFMVKAKRRNLSYTCKNWGNCVITKESKKCNSCRLRNCNSAGATIQVREPDILHFCAVCGDRAFHAAWGDEFGCAGCSQFFKAAILSNTYEYSCSKDGKCEMTRETRTHCRGCRLAKCFQVGMLADRVKQRGVAA